MKDVATGHVPAPQPIDQRPKPTFTGSSDHPPTHRRHPSCRQTAPNSELTLEVLVTSGLDGRITGKRPPWPIVAIPPAVNNNSTLLEPDQTAAAPPAAPPPSCEPYLNVCPPARTVSAVVSHPAFIADAEVVPRLVNTTAVTVKLAVWRPAGRPNWPAVQAVAAPCTLPLGPSAAYRHLPSTRHARNRR